MADPQREDAYALPPQGTVWKNEPEEGGRMFLSKDSSSAAFNAAVKVWPDFDVIETTCNAHAAHIWLKKSDNKRLFSDEENIDHFREDVNTFKIVPLIHVIVPVFDAMVDKWGEIELEMIRKWSNSWASKRLTAVEANEDTPLCGGTPTDNNTIESTNNHDKTFQERASVDDANGSKFGRSRRVPVDE